MAGSKAKFSGGSRRTRKSKTAKLYVIQKIAHKLYEKKKLHAYRKPITIALERHRRKCMRRHPDISKQCLELIKRYGEPLHSRLFRAAKRETYQFVKLSLNKTAKQLSSFGLENTRKVLGEVKRYITGKRKKESSLNKIIQVKDIEITYGLKAFGNASVNAIENNKEPNQNPEVSVILVAPDSTESIKNALGSVISQKFEDFELLIVGREPDRESNILLRQVDANRVRYISIDDPAFVSSYWNAGMREAKGNIISFMSSNDEWFPQKLTREVNLFNTTSEKIGLIYSGIEVVRGSDNPKVFRYKLEMKSYRRLLLQNKMHGASGLSIRRNVMANAGFFDEKLTMMETHDFILRIARYYKFEYARETLLRHQSPTGLKRKPSHIDYILEGRRLFFEKHRLDMKEEKAAQIYLLHSARLQMKKRTKEGRMAAKRLALQAFKEDPFNSKAYWLIYKRYYLQTGKKR